MPQFHVVFQIRHSIHATIGRECNRHHRVRQSHGFYRADERAEEELTALALEGLNSGEAVEVGEDYWEAKHRRLDERLKKTGNP